MDLPTVTLACSGLGHVRRGNEAWARDVAEALHQAGVPVRLLGGGPHPGGSCPYRRLRCLRRDLPVLRRVLSWSRRYLLEQLTFLPALRRAVRVERARGTAALVHLCDPDLALQFVKRTRDPAIRTVFKDGMLLGPEWCGRFPFVQVLAPYYRDVLAYEAGIATDGWFVIPHLIDTTIFRPCPESEVRRAIRREFGLGEDALVVLAVGDFSPAGHKRLDWVVSEAGALPTALKVEVVLVGQAEPGVLETFQNRLPSALSLRVHFLPNQPRAVVARLYQAVDVLAHAALREPFGIVFLEALASGVPVVGHDWPVTRWILGDAGTVVDMQAPGALTSLLRRWAESPGERAELSARARIRAEDMFARDRIVPRYLELYQAMSAAGHRRYQETARRRGDGVASGTDAA